MRRSLSTVIILCTFCAAALWAACVRTWSTQDLFQRVGWIESEQRYILFGLGLLEGRVVSWRETIDAPPGPHVTQAPPENRFSSLPAQPHTWGWHWFEWEYTPPVPIVALNNVQIPGQYSSWRVGFRIWPVALAASAVPMAWLSTRWLRRRGKRKGLCPKCRYDLRATPSRCPECGHEPQPA